MADVSQTPANVRAGTGAVVSHVQAGEAFSAGQPVYLSSTDGKYYKCDANDSSKIGIKGIAVTGASADEDYFVVQTGGECNIGGTTVKGYIYIVSATGGIAPSADLASGWYPVVVGVATDTSGNLELILENGSEAVA